jgi:hypothetical protein
LFVAVLLLAVSGMAMAADFPKLEIFGGYSLLRSDLNPKDLGKLSGGGLFGNSFFGSVENLNGFNASVSYNLNSWLGIKADFSGNFGKQYVNNTSYDNEAYGEWSYGWNAATNAMTSTFYVDASIPKDTLRMSGNVSVRNYTLTFGPEFSFRKHEKIRPFAHALFGINKIRTKTLIANWQRTADYLIPFMAGCPLDDPFCADSESSPDLYYPPNPAISPYPVWMQQEYTDGNITIGPMSSTGFAMVLGGGVDVKINKRLSARVIEFSYVPTYHEFNANLGFTQKYYTFNNRKLPVEANYSEFLNGKIPADRYNNIRLSFGLVVNF